jgi:hypothetical protein
MRHSLLALALLAGCGDAPFTDSAPVRPRGVEFTADRTAYDNDDEAALRLVNRSADTLVTGVLECAVLERWTGTAWETSGAGNERPCIEIAVNLEPGDALDGRVRLDVPDGSYRFVHDLYGEGTERAATAAFRVE